MTLNVICEVDPIVWTTGLDRKNFLNRRNWYLNQIVKTGNYHDTEASSFRFVF